MSGPAGHVDDPPITGHRNTEDTEKNSVHSVLQWLKVRCGAV